MRRPAIKSLAVATATLAFAGTASAWFTSNGSGEGQGNANVSMQNVTLSGAVPATKLYPGGSAAVATTISNPNGSRAHVGSLVLDTSQGDQGFGVDAGHPDCVAKDHLTFAPQTSGWPVPANGTVPVSLPNAVTLSATAPNACQGATFTVYLKAGA